MVERDVSEDEEVLVLKQPVGSFEPRRPSVLSTPSSTERLPGDEWFRGIGVVLLAFLVSRVVLGAIGLLSTLIIRPGPGYAGRAGSALIDIWETWDSAALLEFATTGRVGEAMQLGQGEWNFNPLFALLARLATWITTNPHWGGLLVANFAFLGALFMLRAYTRRVHGMDLADRVVVIAAMLPGSFVLSGYHPDGVFLFLAAASLYCLERDWWLESAVLIGLASAASGVGVILALVFVFRWFQAQGWAGVAPRALLAFIVLLGVSISGRVITLAYLDALAGDPLAAFRALPAWLAQFHDPFQLIASPLVRIARSGLTGGGGDPLPLAADVTGAISIIAAVVTLLMFTRRITVGEGVLAVGCLFLPLAEGFPLSPRLLLAVVPLYPAIAAMTPSVMGAALVTGGLGMLNGLAMAAFATGSELYR